jgi:sRNA-binding regulator protein Hfq
VVVLSGDEVIQGVIEWYDKNCIKVHRANEPNLLIMKSTIRYIYKENESKHASSSGDGNRLPENGQEDFGQG